MFRQQHCSPKNISTSTPAKAKDPENEGIRMGTHTKKITAYSSEKEKPGVVEQKPNPGGSDAIGIEEDNGAHDDLDVINIKEVIIQSS